MAKLASDTERTYQIDQDAISALRAAPGLTVSSAAAEPDEVRDETYYDTPDFRLAVHDVTLRQLGADPALGWDLRQPVGPNAWAHSRHHGPGAGEAPPELAAQVRSLTRGAPLAPVAHVRITRTRYQLRDATGAAVGEVADEQVAAQTLGPSTMITGWHEIEVALSGADGALARSVDRRLRGAGARPGGDRNVLSRLFAGQVTKRPAAKVRTPGKKPTAGDVVLAYLARQVEALLVADREVRAGEPGSVRRMRAAARRLHRTLRAFRPLLRTRSISPIERELRWLADLFAVVLDAEAMRVRISHRLSRPHLAGPSSGVAPVAAAPTATRRDLEQAFVATEAAGRAVLMVELDGERYFHLLDALDALLADPPLRGKAGKKAKKVLPKRIRDGYDHATRRAVRWSA